VVELSVIDCIFHYQCSWEDDVQPQLATDGQLGAYRHRVRWQPMVTLRDRTRLGELWATEQATWKPW